MKTAHVHFDSARGLLVGALDDGMSIESTDRYDLAKRMYARGARHGHVSMPDCRAGDTAPTVSDRIAFQARLNQLGRTA